MTQTTNGYETSDGLFVDTRDVILHPSAARTATANGAVVEETGRRRTLALGVTVSARSGTDPTLDVVVQTSVDGSTWYSAGAFTQFTNTGSQRKTFVLDRYVRLQWTIGGTDTPTFTFSASGELV